MFFGFGISQTAGLSYANASLALDYAIKTLRAAYSQSLTTAASSDLSAPMIYLAASVRCSSGIQRLMRT